MKKRFLSILLLVLIAVLASTTLVACDDEQKNNLQKLNTPTVVLEGDLATWSADENADKFEISVDGALSYLENTVTSKKLTDGQTFKIRAVGDSVKYATSDWSNSVTYSTGSSETDDNTDSTNDNTDSTNDNTETTGGESGGENNPTPPNNTKAPTYLTILASSSAPSQSVLPSLPSLSKLFYSSLIQAQGSTLNDLLTDPDLSLGETLPAASDYTVYSAAGNTVYIQIWLDNPDQNTILSIKLGGTKYQSGGALQSFFIKNGNSYLNCVYVAVTVPQNTYGEIDYQVTEIEYVEGNNVSQDGKAVLIDPEKDTVTVGLRYKDSALGVTANTAPTVTASSVSLTYQVTDGDGYLTKTGGWLRAVLLDSGNRIVEQKKLTVGSNPLSFNGLGAGNRYTVAVVLVADIHDGNGVAVHTLTTASVTTSQAVTVEVESNTLRDEANGKQYASISVDGTLSDPAFTFSKVEIYHYSFSSENLVYTGAFTGSAEIRNGILSGTDYVVRVYYKNGAGIEQYAESRTYTDRLYMPSVTLESEYGLLTHAVLGFNFSEEDSCNTENLILRVWREDSKQYIAADALYLLNNPTAIDDLQSRLDSIDRYENGDEFHEVYLELDRLRGVQQRMENEYSELTLADWETLAEGSRYFYEIALDDSDDAIKTDDGGYLVTLRGLQSLAVGESCRYELVADLDYNNGEPVELARDLCSGYFTIKPAIDKNDYLFVVMDENFDNLFTLDGNRLYLEVMSRNNLGNETYRALGYVNQIVLARESSYDIVEVLWSQDAPAFEIDEEAWLADVLDALLADEDPDSVFPLGELEPIEIDINPTTKIPGNYHIRFTYIMLGKTYTSEDPYDWDGAVIDYFITAQLPTATITFEKDTFEYYGSWHIQIPEELNCHWENYEIEVCDANGTLLYTYTEEDWDRARLDVGQKIRIRLLEMDGRPYTDGEWSEWFVCEPFKIPMPRLSVGYSGNDLIVAWETVELAEKYLCTVNGVEQTVTETTLTVPNGAKITVIALPPETDGRLAPSDVSEELTATDTRQTLATPNVSFEVDSEGVMVRVTWDAVDGAARYEVYNVTEGTVQRMLGASVTSYVLKTSWGGTYRIRAIPENYDEYRASDYSILISW